MTNSHYAIPELLKPFKLNPGESNNYIFQKRILRQGIKLGSIKSVANNFL